MNSGATRLRFTKKQIEALEPEAAHLYAYDTEVRGLAIRITPNGIKTFILSRKIRGRQQRITLGRFPEFTIEQARGRASEINGRIAKGEDPTEEKRPLPDLTLGELWREYLDRHAKPHKKPRTLEEDQGLWDRHLKPWQRRRLQEISKKDVATLHARLGEQRGHYAANRMHSLLRHMFNLAIQWDLFEDSNPCSGITRFKEQSRERFIQPHEMPRFIAAVYQEKDETLRDVILILLLTGARKSNVTAMRFEEVDFDGRVWRIPDSKSGEPLTIPLVPEAMNILRARQAQHEKSPWVFPSSRRRDQHVREIKGAWARACRAAGLSGLRIHDARRTTGSWMASGNTSLHIIGKALGHKSLSATQIYSRLNTDPVREALEKATGAMFSIAKDNPA